MGKTIGIDLGTTKDSEAEKSIPLTNLCQACKLPVEAIGYSVMIVFERRILPEGFRKIRM